MTHAMTTPIAPPRRRWRTWLLAALIFIGGAAVGSALTAGAIFRGVHRAIAHPEEAPQRITARLTRRLDLSEDQAAKVRQIIASRQKSLLQIRRDVQPRIEAQLDVLESEIAAVLTPAQQQKWRELTTTFRRNWLPPPPAPPATVRAAAPSASD